MLHYEDRIRIIQGGFDSGEYILYWMRTAVRIDHNPALITALELGKKYDKPVLAMLYLNGTPMRLTDTIPLSLKELSTYLKVERASHTVCVSRRKKRTRDLPRNAAKSLAVVTEDVPIPFAKLDGGLAERSNTTMYLVDTDCLVPMKLSRKAPTRALFRDRFKAEENTDYTILISTYQSLVVQRKWTRPSFEPVDLERVSISDLLRECTIDHSVLPVTHTVGGSDAAQKRCKN